MVHSLRGSILSLLAVHCLAVAGPALAAENPTGTPARPGAPRYTNRLINSADPYLLLHAHNPVDWYPWGPEALARAKKENKPIFLSVGYSTCYWCHVAEKKLYSRPEIAALMNQWFINIKVDREQLPDLDRIYMLATQLMTGHGGWPNNVFLTPDLKPFFAGSYFGPTDGDLGRPGFPTVLKKLHELWTTDEARVRAAADQTFQAMQRVQAKLAGGRAVALLPREWLAAAREGLARSFDAAHGGFGRGAGPKFPQEPRLMLLLTDTRLNRSADSQRMLEKTVEAMAAGGIHDQLAGGFHRYSTEPTWSIPHFEKMLYNNAQLLAVYTGAHEMTGNPLYAHVATGLADYLMAQMLDPGGGFYSAQDAEVSGEEGASYVWTREEIAAVLGPEELRRFFTVYELTPMPRLGGGLPASAAGSGVLRLRPELMRNSATQIMDSLNATASMRGKLLQARNRRPQPLRDDRIVVGVNGLAIEAFVQSSRVLRRSGDLEVAKRTAERLWSLAYNPGTRGLAHEIFKGRPQVDGYLEDYALLGNGFLSLYEATKVTLWRDRATALADDLIRRFLREDGRLSTSPNEKSLLIVPQDHGDETYASGTSAAVALLLRLAEAGVKPQYATFAERVVRFVSGGIQERPDSWGAMVSTLNLHGVGMGKGKATTTRPSPPDAPGGIPTSAEHVRVTVSAATRGEHDEIVAILRVDPGWHINANPASFDYLIPTSVSFEGLSPTRVIYPAAVRIKPRFAPDGLDVYEGVTRLVAIFPKAALGEIQKIRGTITLQACTDEECLLPSTIAVTPEERDAPGAR